MNEPKELIENVTFGFDKSKTTCGPHIAYTLPSQGGAASGKNKSFLFKSDGEVSNETLKEIEGLGLMPKTEITKNNTLAYNRKQILQLALETQLSQSDDDCCYSYIYVTDFDSEYVYYYHNDGIYGVGYSFPSEGNVALNGEPQRVIQLQDFYFVDDQIMIRDEATADTGDNVVVMLSKAVSDKEFVGNIKDIVNKQTNLDTSSSNDEDEDEDKEEQTSATRGIEKSKEEIMELNIQDVIKSKEFTDYIDAHTAEIKKVYDGKLKAAEDRAKAIEKAAQEEKLGRIEKGFTKEIEGLSLIAEDDRSAIVKGLVENHSVDVIIKMLDLLGKYEEEITKVKDEFATTNHGSDAATVPSEEVNKSVQDLESRFDEKFADKKYL